MLGVLGLAALVVGLRAAWRTDAATPALVVAAVLIALAILFTPDLEELSARWKEAAVTYRRTKAVAYTEISEALQVALGLEEGQDFRSTIEEIASESSKAAIREQKAADREIDILAAKFAEIAQRSGPKPVSPLARALAKRDKPQAIHAIEEGQVTLTVMHPPTRGALAIVQTPEGQRHTHLVFRLGDAPSASTRYPGDFGPDVPPLSEGRHTVQWRSVTLSRGDDGKLKPELGPVFATDTIEISELLASPPAAQSGQQAAEGDEPAAEGEQQAAEGDEPAAEGERPASAPAERS